MTTIPTIRQLYEAIISDLETEFSVTIEPNGKTFFSALAAVQAATLYQFYLGAANVQKNIWVDTAEPASVGGTLERFGYTKLGRLPYPASEGVYTCTVTGTAGAVIPATTTFKSDDSSLNPGFLFILDTAFTFSGSSGSISLRALDAGRGSLLAVADTLTATSPLINASQQATVTAISTDPVNAETTEEYRQKAEQAYRLTPQGGAAVDYRLWGSEAAGVRQIYPYASQTEPNEIDVYVEAFPDDSIDGHGTPSPTIITDVEDNIEADPDTGIGRRPIGTFLVNVVSIDPLPVDVAIDSGGAITPEQETLINAALEEFLYEIRPFVAGIDILSERNDTVSVYKIGGVVTATVSGVPISSITIDVGGTPESNYQFEFGQIPYLGTVTYL